MEKYKSEVLRLCNRPIDLENLPEDCPLAASIRMERDYQKTGTFNVRDMDIVLGDISRGVSIGLFRGHISS